MRAQPRIGGEDQLAVEIPQGLAHHGRIREPSRRLEQDLAGGEPGRGFSFGQARGVALELLERHGPAGPVEGGEEDLPDVPPDRFLEVRPVDQREPGEDGAERPPLREHLRHRAIEVLLADEPVADEDVAEVLAGDVAPALDDVPLADRQPAPFPAVGQVEVARPAGHVRRAQQPEQLGRSGRTAGAFERRSRSPSSFVSG